MDVDRRDLRVGVRTVTLDMSADPEEPGTRFFRFVLNGVPIFARGVNWVPASSFVASIDAPAYRRLLTLAAEAHMNMIRVWGGGIYEHDSFYDHCDELGLLVWQDFMFACAPYPEHDLAFVANVRAEVDYQVRRLRHHACMALWCGNNECQAIHGYSNSKNSRDDTLPGVLYYDQVIPELLATLDPGTPWWPGSPFGGPKNNHNSMREGDIHDWTVWHGLPTIPDDVPVGEHDRSPAGVAYTRYAEDTGRFISEFGIQSAPMLATLRRALPDDPLVLGSPGFLSRIKDRPSDKVDAMLVSVTGLPATLEDYIDFTQINQAEGLKFGIEHFRRRKPHCSGTLIWQFNDCWPGISWSIVDFNGFAKAGYHYVRRAYAPVLASFKAAAGVVELWITNDTLVPVDEPLSVALASFEGAGHRTDSVRCRVGPNSSACVWKLDDADRYDARHVLTVRAPSGKIPANRHFFAPIKDLRRPAPSAPIVEIETVNQGETRVTLTARDYLYFVHVLIEDEDAIASDNYVDLAAGEVREIVLRHRAKAIDPATLIVRWR
jgi:beta-mannosidase